MVAKGTTEANGECRISHGSYCGIRDNKTSKPQTVRFQYIADTTSKVSVQKRF